jgi:hypothetical protein
VLTFFSGSSLDAFKVPFSADWYPLLVFLVPVALALVLALAAAERPCFAASRRDALRAGACLPGWVVIQWARPELLGIGGPARATWEPTLVLLLTCVLIMIAAGLPVLLPSPRR